jgi:hypothetical protein
MEKSNSRPELGFIPQNLDMEMEEEEEAPQKLNSKEKTEIYDRYPLVFNKSELLLKYMVPMILPKNLACERMEHIYDKQFEALLRKKTVESMNLSKILIESTDLQYNGNRMQSLQHMSNLVYSAERYGAKLPEFHHFLEFLKADANPERLLFLIYVRQYFKILTYTNFKAHFKTNRDPNLIQISKLESQQILRMAIGHEPMFCEILNRELDEHFKKNKKITYYQFMVIFMTQKLPYKDFGILDRVVGLYAVDYKDELEKSLRHKATKSVTPKREPKPQITQNINTNANTTINFTNGVPSFQNTNVIVQTSSTGTD